MKLAILSDIHSAASAFAAALSDARKEGFDRLILLGDLLTYGPFPERTLEIAHDAMARHEVILIEGNHDGVYRDTSRENARLPATDWIRESMEWTISRIDVDEFTALAWRNEHLEDGVLLAHANPYGFGNWSYLRTDEEFQSAIEALSARGLRGGIFGHSHRYRRVDVGSETAVTVGSVGQPRSATMKSPQWAVVTLGDAELTVESRAVDFDWRSHCEHIRSTDLSEKTKDRLCEFFL